MDAGFSSSLDQFLRDAPGGGSIVSGERSTAQQQVLWDRKVAELQGQGMSLEQARSAARQFVALPGTSWHEKGLAADLRFASPAGLQWAHANAARYGLFFPMSWEPWHVQPTWTQGRKSSDVGDSMGGMTVPPNDGSVQDQQTQQTGTQDGLGAILQRLNTTIMGGGKDNSQFPMDEQSDPFLKYATLGTHTLGSPLGGIAGAGAQGAAAGSVGGGSLNYDQRYQLVISVGGTPQEAQFLARIAEPESGGNPYAHNTNAGTGDNSYGIWQINMLGGMGPDRAKKYGLSSYDQLFDPATNAKAALDIYRTQGQDAWGNSVRKIGAS